MAKSDLAATRTGPKADLHVGPGAVFTGDAVPVASGSYVTSAGTVSWSRAADGTVTAQGAGQYYVGASTTDPDGTRHLTATFAKIGASPYLSAETISRSAQRLVQTTVAAGPSRLTLSITGIDAGVTSGMATVSGSLNGTSISRTGPVDLTTNPFVGTPVPGWPKQAFADELGRAKIFAPVARAANKPPGGTGPLTGHPPHGGPGHIVMESALGVFGRAEAWCLGGAIGGAPGGPGGALAGCVGGAAASLLNDLVTWADEGGASADPDPVPVIDLPPDPEPTGPSTQTQHDDPPPPPPGDSGATSDGGDVSDVGDGTQGGGGAKIDDDDPELHEA